MLGQEVTIREDGRERRVTAAEAFLLHMTKRGLDGDSAAARSLMAAIEAAREVHGPGGYGASQTIVVSWISPGTVNSAMEALRMGTKLDRYRPTARMVIEPWLVEEALARFGDKRLSRDEQAKVVKATRTPHKVRWPDWWEVRP